MVNIMGVDYAESPKTSHITVMNTEDNSIVALEVFTEPTYNLVLKLSQIAEKHSVARIHANTVGIMPPNWTRHMPGDITIYESSLSAVLEYTFILRLLEAIRDKTITNITDYPTLYTDGITWMSYSHNKDELAHIDKGHLISTALVWNATQKRWLYSTLDDMQNGSRFKVRLPHD